MSSGDDEADFWPGYVAASAGLVQALLVVTMALGISIYAVDQLANLADLQKRVEAEREDAKNKLSFGKLSAVDGGVGSSIPLSQFENLTASGEIATRPMQDAQDNASSDSAFDPATALETLVTEQEETDKSSATASTSLAEKREDLERAIRAETYISITFIGDTVEIPASSATEIVAAISMDAVSAAYKWRVVVPSYSNEPRASRAGYLRLVGLRSVLMDAGVPSDRIELDLSEEFETGDPGSVVALLIPYDESGVRLRQADPER